MPGGRFFFVYRRGETMQTAWKYPEAARAVRRFEQAQRIREALSVTAALTAPRGDRGSALPDHMRACPHCGAPMVEQAPKRSTAIRARMLRETAQAVQGCRADVWELIDAALATEHDGTCLRLAAVLGYNATSLQSALVRQGLPSPRQLMRAAFLVRFWEVAQGSNL